MEDLKCSLHLVFYAHFVYFLSFSWHVNEILVWNWPVSFSYQSPPSPSLSPSPCSVASLPLPHPPLHHDVPALSEWVWR